MTETVPSARYRWAAFALGFAISGFFDGILLHQILQWHHLLSGLQDGRFGDLRFQILADGFFHIVMYGVAGVGLWLLWGARHEFAGRGNDRLFLAYGLIGFGAWHILDGILSHWVLGIHRIKMDSDIPLVWDLIWFVPFGVISLVRGLILKAKYDGSDGGSGSAAKRSAHSPTIAAILTIVSGALALMPPAGGDEVSTLVVFIPGTTPSEAMSATLAANGRLIWTDQNNGVWAIELGEDADRSALYRGGALLVSNTFLSAGCLDWFSSETAV